MDCSFCNSQYHYQCLNRNRIEYEDECKNDFLCTNCISNELPYNHFDDDYDFLMPYLSNGIIQPELISDS